MSLTDRMTDEIIKTFRTQYAGNCIAFSLAALSIWEFCITVFQTVELVWRRRGRRLGLSSILLLSARVCMLSNALLTLAGFLPRLNCRVVTVIDFCISIVPFIGSIQMALFTALRISALFDRDMRLFLVVLLFGLSPLVADIYTVSQSAMISNTKICMMISKVSSNGSLILVLVERLTLVAVDIVVVVLTWLKTYQQVRESRRLGISLPLSICLIRDGTVYFLCLLAVNIAEVVTYKPHVGTPAAILTSNLPPILINRFILNLRQAESPRPSTHESGGPSPSFVATFNYQLDQNIVGNMGEPLDCADFTSRDNVIEGEVSSEEVSGEDSLENATNAVRGAEGGSREV